jgi:hypothetical protein
MGICIALHGPVHLNIPDLGQRIFEPTGMRFIEIKISATNTNTRFFKTEISLPEELY